MFRVKICGVTTLEDARLCAEAGADAIGLNFYSASPRYVTPSVARTIALGLPTTVTKVGVFVNVASADVKRICADVGLDAVQLHGDEPPQQVQELRGQRVIKAFRCARQDLQRITGFLDACQALGCRLDAILVDAYQSGSFGGTGRVADWSLVRWLCDLPITVPVVVAGGLRPENVAAAIEATRAAAVDTASGVECSPGRKDPTLVMEFVRNAQMALESLVGPDLA